MTEANKPKHVVLTDDEVMNLDRRDLLSYWRKQVQYVSFIEEKYENEVKQLNAKLDQARRDVYRKESLMMYRLAVKDRQLREFTRQIDELKSSKIATSMKSLYLDPAVNLLVEKLRSELKSTKSKLEHTQEELTACKFTADSQTGKRLMAKCRLLRQENDNLGKVISSGKLAKLESELSLQKNLNDEMKKSQSEMDEFVHELDDDMESMQATIVQLQQRLGESSSEAMKRQPPACVSASSMQPCTAGQDVERRASNEDDATAASAVLTRSAAESPQSGGCDAQSDARIGLDLAVAASTSMLNGLSSAPTDDRSTDCVLRDVADLSPRRHSEDGGDVTDADHVHTTGAEDELCGQTEKESELLIERVTAADTAHSPTEAEVNGVAERCRDSTASHTQQSDSNDAPMTDTDADVHQTSEDRGGENISGGESTAVLADNHTDSSPLTDTVCSQETDSELTAPAKRARVDSLSEPSHHNNGSH